MLEFIKQQLSRLVEFILPAQCLLCGLKNEPCDKTRVHHLKNSIDTELICDICSDSMIKERACCQHCSLSLPKSQAFCGDCLKQPHYFSSIHAIGDYHSPFSSLIKKFKYSQNLLEGELLGILLVRSILFNFSDNKIGDVDYLLPVPLHLDKLRKRGFNQAMLIAQVVSKALTIPILDNTVIRNKKTIPQEGLFLNERKKNLQGAFSVNNIQTLKEKHIVIIDDVVTTGATVNSLCKVLFEKNAKQVDIWCISRTSLKV